jgi:hypothetical protein
MATAKAKSSKTQAKRRAAPVKPVSARVLLRGLAQLQEQRGLDELVLLGALCEVIATHQPTARQALARIQGMLDDAGIR